jgi:predicted transcriptional regulator
MENSVGLGGITLVVAAVVWLAIFVPGFSKRSEIRANSSIVKRDVKMARQAAPLTADERLSRLVNTQRFFSVLFALFLIGSISSAVAATLNAGWWLSAVFTGTLAIFSILVSRAASVQAAAIASKLHRTRQEVRKKASAQRPVVENRTWEPNPIPAPLNQPRVGELVNNLADVVEIQRPENVFDGKELDAILARRRAI